MEIIHKKYMVIVFLNLISGCSSTETSSFLGGVMDVVKANPQILNGDLESPITYPENEEIENTDASSSESNDENIDENNDGVVDKVYYPNGKLQWEFFYSGDFRIDKHYREDGSYKAETKFNKVNHTLEHKNFNEKGQLETHSYYDGNSNPINQEQYNKLNPPPINIKHDNSLTNNSSEVIDEEVQRYLNDPSSPIDDRERLVKYLHKFNGARLKIYYHPNGMVSNKDYYKDDKFELYKIYNESGKLVKILVYDIVVGSQYE